VWGPAAQTRVIREHVVQELGNRGHLEIPAVQKTERQQRIVGRLHPTSPCHVQRRNVPDRRALLCHPYLRVE